MIRLAKARREDHTLHDRAKRLVSGSGRHNPILDGSAPLRQVVCLAYAVWQTEAQTGARLSRYAQSMVDRWETGELNFDVVHGVVVEAVRNHLADEPEMVNGNERARVARLLVHLDRLMQQDERFQGLSVDSEYSRVGAGLQSKEFRGRKMFPDLLIHTRTTQDLNLLAIEVKLRKSSRPRSGPDRVDQAKISAMTDVEWGRPREIAPYKMGLCLSLDGGSAEAWWTVPSLDCYAMREWLA